jgi:hypothetical protein
MCPPTGGIIGVLEKMSGHAEEFGGGRDNRNADTLPGSPYNAIPDPMPHSTLPGHPLAPATMILARDIAKSWNMKSTPPADAKLIKPSSALKEAISGFPTRTTWPPS